MLNNLILAIRTMEKNWAFITQVVICLLYTALIIFDLIVVIIDANTVDKSDFVKDAF